MTPEYNRSIGASPGALGTALAQQHLRNVLAHLDMMALGQPEGFFRVQRDDTLESDSDLLPGDGTRLLKTRMETYLRWVQRLAGRSP